LIEDTPEQKVGLSGSPQTSVHVISWFSIFAIAIGWVALIAGVIAALLYFYASSDTRSDQAAALIGLGIGSFFAGTITFLICLGVGIAVDHLEVIRKELEKK